jgi:type I restriction enzyme S subunit
MIKQGWPATRLGEVLRRVERFESRDNLTEYPFAGTYSFARGIFVGERKQGSTFSLPKIQRIREGDFVYCKIMAWEGAFGIVPREADNCVLSGAFVVYELNSEYIDQSFLDYFFKVPAHWQRIGRQSSGTNVRRQSLHPVQFEKAEIPLPPLAEQRRIVTRIEQVAAQVNEARALRQQAVNEAEGLWARGAARTFEQIEQAFPLRCVADVVSVRGGGTPSKANPFYWSGSIPWVTPKDMKVREIHGAIDHISSQAITESSAKLIEPGAVLVVVRGMILAHTFPSAILRVPATINQDMKALIPKPDVLPEYLCAFLWAYNDQILGRVEKSTHDTRKLETPVLMSIKLPVPPLAEQRRIVAQLDDLQMKTNALMALQSETSAEIDALMPSILDKALRGEL